MIFDYVLPYQLALWSHHLSLRWVMYAPNRSIILRIALFLCVIYWVPWQWTRCYYLNVQIFWLNCCRSNYSLSNILLIILPIKCSYKNLYKEIISCTLVFILACTATFTEALLHLPPKQDLNHYRSELVFLVIWQSYNPEHSRDNNTISSSRWWI